MSEVVLHSLYVSISEPSPPSVNHLYTNGYRGRRVLSKAGVTFKTALTSVVAQECMFMPWKQVVDDVYEERAWVRMVIVVHAGILNGAWKPKSKTAKGSRRSPYKKLDATSYIKCIEDAVADGTGIDDSAHMDVRVLKVHGPVPYVEVAYEVLAYKEDHGALCLLS
jgi:hypothetical protein